MIYAKINGLNYPVAAGFSIEEQIGNRTSSNISVKIGSRPVPTAGNIIELFDSLTQQCIFWGICRIVRRSDCELRPAAKTCELVCANANDLLSRRLVNVALQEKTVTQIVTKLFEDYIACDGITLGAVSDFDMTVAIYTASDLNLQKALDELAEFVGAGWNITSDRKFIFAKKEDFPRLAIPLTENLLPLYDVGSVCKDSDVRTVQIIKGSSEKTDTQLESYVYNGVADNFTLSFPVSAKPIIRVDSIDVPASAVGINGLNSNDPTKAFLFSFQSQTILYNPANTSLKLEKNNVVEFEYIGFFPIRVEVSDSARIEAVRSSTNTSGIIENVSVSHSLASWSDAQGLAQALLDDFGHPRRELQFSFDSVRIAQFGLSADDFALFTVLDVRFPDIAGEYVITERRIEPVTAGTQNSRFRITVKCVDRSILKGYGSVLFSMKHELANLRVRPDEKVLSNVNNPETMSLTEITALSPTMLFYPASSGIFEPADLCTVVYPS